MGIPRFAYRMKDYAQTVTIGSLAAGDEHDGRLRPLAVIDGPSLAHYILHSREHEPNKDREIVPACNYAELGRQTIIWLDMLSPYGFEIESIYFDGALPRSKKPIRESRLKRYTDKLVEYKRTYEQVTRSVHRKTSITPTDPNARRLEVARRNLPPPPFLVFAVVEALFNSHYANRTWVVPGEADAFCAAAAARKGSPDHIDRPATIFTNDSDLLIFTHAPLTNVVMIDSIVRVVEDGNSTLVARQCSPQKLASMGPKPLHDLIRPAFAMQSAQVTFMEALNQSQSCADSEEYDDFAKSFSTDRAGLELHNLRRLRKTGLDELQIDSRVAEMIYSAIAGACGDIDSRSSVGSEIDYLEGICMVVAREDYWQHGLEDLASLTPAIDDDAATRSTSNRHDLQFTSASQTLDVYLPVLVDDPSRASAWQIGARFRHAAEVLVLRWNNLDCQIVEYRKAGNGTAMNGLNTSLGEFLPGQCERWAGYIKEELDCPTSLSKANQWRLLIMKLMLADMLREIISIPQAEDLVSILSRSPVLTWSLVHLKAQFEAEYYSVRMLTQVLNYMKRATASIRWLGQLFAQIDGLPGIAEFFCLESIGTSEVDQTEWRALVDELLASLGIDPREEPPHKEAKSTEKAAVERRQPEKTARYANRFGILGEE